MTRLAARKLLDPRGDSERQGTGDEPTAGESGPSHGIRTLESAILGPSTLDGLKWNRSGRTVNHLLHVFPSFGFGGVPIRICSIINHFGARYRHTILSLDSCLDSRIRVDPAIDVDFRPVRASKYGLLSNVVQYRRHLKALRPDLLLTYNWGSVEWAFANALAPICPNVHLESGFQPEEADGQLARRVLFRRLALARVWRTVVPSKTLATIATEIWKLPKDKVVRIPNGVELDRFANASPGTIQGLNGVSCGHLVLGTLAPLRPEKNVARLVRVFARLRNSDGVKLVIVGDGAERPRLEQLAEDLEVRDKVIFTGHLEQVERAISLFDVFALSSDTEQMPNSLIQAMAGGKPVAAVDVGDVKDILADENRAFVVDKNNEADFVAVLERLLADGQLRNRLGRLNQERVSSQFTQERMFEAYAEIFRGPA